MDKNITKIQNTAYLYQTLNLLSCANTDVVHMNFVQPWNPIEGLDQIFHNV